MASVYYLFDDSCYIKEEIVQKFVETWQAKAKIIYEAVKIQKTWKAYKARQRFLEMTRAAEVLQRFFLGWSVRVKLPEIYHIYYDNMCVKRYHEAATLIQRVWKGYQIRKEVCIKCILEEREMVQKANDKMMMEMNTAFEKAEDPEDVENVSKVILSILFHRHHLLRTKNHEGVLSNHGSKELSILEKLLDTISWTEFYKKAYQIYEKTYNNKGPKYFKEIERTECYKYKEEFNLKAEFNAWSRLINTSYEKNMLSSENYKPFEGNITRTIDPNGNISSTDFNLHVLKAAVKKCSVPPYYLDFWFKDYDG